MPKCQICHKVKCSHVRLKPLVSIALSPISDTVRVPVFQLLQWKYAVKLEAKGIRFGRRSVRAHAARILKCKRTEVVAVIDEILGSIPMGGPHNE